VKPSEKIKNFIKSKEGLSLVAYRPIPTDKPTIGYGSTYYIDGTPVTMGDKIDLESANHIFEYHLDSFVRQLNDITPAGTTQNQFDAILSLCYNIGFRNFATSTSGKLYKEGQDIARRILLWNLSGGKPVKGLTNRRIQERAIYEYGLYP
jgi:lysozyme